MIFFPRAVIFKSGCFVQKYWSVTVTRNAVMRRGRLLGFDQTKPSCIRLHSCSELPEAGRAGRFSSASARTEGGASWPPHREYRPGRRRDSALTSFWSESPNLTYGEKEGGIGKEERKTAHSTLHFILLFGRGNSPLYLLKGYKPLF